MKPQYMALVIGLVLFAAACGPVASRAPESDPAPEPLPTVAAVPASASPAKVVETAPDITLVASDGQFLLSELRGKVVLLYFSFPG